MDDIWLEYMSGQFIIDVVPHKDTPQINMLFASTSDSADSGMAIRVRMDRFRSRGDKGVKIPKVSVDRCKVTAKLRVHICLHFDVVTSKWVCPPKQFKVDLISFRGPYGTRRSVVSATISLLVIPALRSFLLENMPMELGYLIRTLSSPLSVRGKYEVRGTNIKVLSRAMHKDAYMCDLSGYTPQQLFLFQNIQRSLDRCAARME